MTTPPHATHPDRDDVVDLRSDTLTQPTDAMRQAMAEAPVGDALFGEDPTVARLEKTAAKRLGKEAALFVPSGTMANLIAILTHTGGRKEVIAERRAHVFNYETGGLHALGGCGMWPIDAPGGVFTPEQLDAALRPKDFVHAAQGLVVVENSVNGWGGTVWTRTDTQAVATHAQEHELPVHVDGARIFNAAAALDTDPAALAAPADSLMFSLSKGLSAPVGSILLGDAAFIDRAVAVRKQLGGAMRQAGHLAAAGLVALDTMVDRLQDDHAAAKRLAAALADRAYDIDPKQVQTNILVFDVRAAGWTDANHFVRALATHGVHALAVAPTEVRFVTHRHITPEKVAEVAAVLDRLSP